MSFSFDFVGTFRSIGNVLDREVPDRLKVDGSFLDGSIFQVTQTDTERMGERFRYRVDGDQYVYVGDPYYGDVRIVSSDGMYKITRESKMVFFKVDVIGKKIFVIDESHREESMEVCGIKMRSMDGSTAYVKCSPEAEVSFTNIVPYDDKAYNNHGLKAVAKMIESGVPISIEIVGSDDGDLGQWIPVRMKPCFRGQFGELDFVRR